MYSMKPTRRPAFGDLDVSALVQQATEAGAGALQTESGALVQQLPDALQGGAQSAIDAGLAAATKALPPLVTKAVNGAVDDVVGRISGGSVPTPAQSSRILTEVMNDPKLLAAFQGQVAQAIAVISTIPGAAQILKNYKSSAAYQKWAADLAFIRARPDLKNSSWNQAWLSKGMAPSTVDPLSAIADPKERERTRVNVYLKYNYPIGPASTAAMTKAKAAQQARLLQSLHVTTIRKPPASPGVPTWVYVAGGVAVLGIGALLVTKA